MIRKAQFGGITDNVHVPPLAPGAKELQTFDNTRPVGLLKFILNDIYISLIMHTKYIQLISTNSLWKIHVKVNDITVSAVVDTAAEINTVAQNVAHAKMSPQSEIISRKDVNVAAGACTSMTVGD